MNGEVSDENGVVTPERYAALLCKGLHTGNVPMSVFYPSGFGAYMMRESYWRMAVDVAADLLKLPMTAEVHYGPELL